MSNPVVLITGGLTGIGRAAAVRFASEGARVVVVDLAAAALRQSVAAVEKVDGELYNVEFATFEAVKDPGKVKK